VQVSAFPRADATAAERFEKALEWPMALLALAVVPALLLDDGASTPQIHLVATAINWVVWVAFVADLGIRASVAPDRSRFLRRSWLDLLIIAISPPVGVPDSLQSLRAVRAFRLLRLLRAFAFLAIGIRASKRALRHRKFHYVLTVTTAVMALGAVGLFVVERQQNEAITSFADALWWAVTTTTTVGYGDIYPKTGEGRLIAVVLMLTGIGVIGIFTATIASFFLMEEENDGLQDVKHRLATIENKLDRLLADREKH
jgi:voltage-gated potassium channel